MIASGTKGSIPTKHRTVKGRWTAAPKRSEVLKSGAASLKTAPKDGIEPSGNRRLRLEFFRLTRTVGAMSTTNLRNITTLGRNERLL
jgi:hypothetical protein